MPSISDLKSKKSRILSEATELQQRTTLRTAEDKAKFHDLLKASDEVEADIHDLERIESFARSRPEVFAKPAHIAATVPTKVEDAQTRRARLNAAWRDYFSGRQSDTEEFRNLLTSTTGADGGAVVPLE